MFLCLDIFKGNDINVAMELVQEGLAVLTNDDSEQNGNIIENSLHINGEGSNHHSMDTNQNNLNLFNNKADNDKFFAIVENTTNENYENIIKEPIFNSSNLLIDSERLSNSNNLLK